jgi:drug/metabolite transporter (DMT)-like permease
VNRVAQHPVKAFAVALAAVGCLSIMDAVMKHLVLAIGIIAVSIWRSIVNLVLSGTLYLPRRLQWPSRSTLKIHISRGVLVTGLAFLFFWGIGRVPLAQAIALTFIGPLIALLLAALFLKEHIGPSSIIGSIAAFAGVIVIVLGQARARIGSEAMLGSAAILGSAICYAANIVMMRPQAQAAGPLEINFFQSLTVMIVWLIVLPFVGLPSSPGWQWPWIGVAALLSTCGTLLYGWAYARGEASYLAVTEYSAFLWASALGWLVFREGVSLYTLGGALMIVGGCLLAARRKVAVLPEIDVAA